ncbi:MerR family transcriptional regulator [Flavicella sediminum]|uniref:MerR family transcriptional regulator n=1 Tax=Flavicella sediminum TaxID=2585141 RepID=UPI001123DEF8|nr:MerR family transcriptional regulator [Flavicella sediminum]
MNTIKNTFTIYDLEILSGIKAHTIRIWEKRYAVFNPDRINRNVRIYSLLDLQKMLNLSLLYNHGIKISKLTDLSDRELADKAKEVALEGIANNYQINALIVSMYTFDVAVFQDVYLEEIKNNSFETIFISIYLPLLKHIGVLWQTESIKPAHEHFISNLIYKKISLHISKLPRIEDTTKTVHVLFLPEGEGHEIGLYFLNYYLLSKGQRTIYLGQSIPFEDLFFINSQFQNIQWVSSFVIDLVPKAKKQFVINAAKLLENTKNNFWIIGSIWDDFEKKNLPKNISFYNGFKELIKL